MAQGRSQFEPSDRFASPPLCGGNDAELLKRLAIFWAISMLGGLGAILLNLDVLGGVAFGGVASLVVMFARDRHL
jgi:hypothetical protein